MHPRGATLRQLPTADLTPSELSALCALFSAAWPDGGFTDDDFAHGMGGIHWLAEVDGAIVSHASVVARRLEAGDRVLRTGIWRRSRRCRRPTARLRLDGGVRRREVPAAPVELGALSTQRPRVYLRMGSGQWLGPTSVRTPDGLRRTEDDDGRSSSSARRPRRRSTWPGRCVRLALGRRLVAVRSGRLVGEGEDAPREALGRGLPQADRRSEPGEERRPGCRSPPGGRPGRTRRRGRAR